MSSRPFVNPAHSSEVIPDKPRLAESVAIGIGLAILIVSVQLWRLIFGRPISKER